MKFYNFFLQYKFKNIPLFSMSPFLAMDLVQTEIRSGNVQLDKMYSLYLIECSIQNKPKNSLMPAKNIFLSSKDKEIRRLRDKTGEGESTPKR